MLAHWPLAMSRSRKPKLGSGQNNERTQDKLRRTTEKACICRSHRSARSGLVCPVARAGEVRSAPWTCRKLAGHRHNRGRFPGGPRWDRGEGLNDFRWIKFKVTGAALNLQRLVVTYETGAPNRIDVRHNIPEGGESRQIDLAGAGTRRIRRIDFWYDTKGFLKGKAHVTLFGMK